jgi:hypothetical protein
VSLEIAREQTTRDNIRALARASPRQRQASPCVAGARLPLACKRSVGMVPASCKHAEPPLAWTGKADLMEQTDAALLRSELLLKDMLSSGLFDEDADVLQHVASEASPDDQVGSGPAACAAAPGSAEAPTGMLETLAEMWEEMKSHGDIGKHAERSVASTRCPSPSASTISLHSLTSALSGRHIKASKGRLSRQPSWTLLDLASRSDASRRRTACNVPRVSPMLENGSSQSGGSFRRPFLAHSRSIVPCQCVPSQRILSPHRSW